MLEQASQPMTLGWDDIAAIAQVIAATVAALSLVGIWLQIAHSRKVADVQVIQAFRSEARDLEGTLNSSRTEEDLEVAFIDFLNFIECYALIVERKLVPETSRELITQKVRDSLAILVANDHWNEQLKEAITGPDTFDALKRFKAKHKQEIFDLAEKMRQIELLPE